MLLSAAALEFEMFVSVIVVPDEDQGWEQPQLFPWVLKFGPPLAAERKAATDREAKE